MKYIIKIFIAVISLFSIFAVQGQETATPAAPVYNVISTFDDAAFDSPIALVDEETRSPSKLEPLASAASAAGSAPPLTRVAVYAVGSTLYGDWEYMTTLGQLTTVGDHGGAQLRVVVQEIGYGSTPIAYMAGSLLSTAKNYQNTPICIVGGYYTSPCPAGYTIVGWYRYFNLDGYNSGQFTYRNTSLNSPWNTLSTGIYIR